MAVKVKEKCKKCFHFQVCASVLQNDLFIREVMLGEKEPECKQFVEVVRCKDCTFYRPLNSQGEKEWGTCKKINVQSTYPNEFCSRGERRNDGK